MFAKLRLDLFGLSLFLMFAAPLSAQVTPLAPKTSAGAQTSGPTPLADRHFIELYFTFRELDEAHKVLNVRTSHTITYSHPLDYSSEASIDQSDQVPVLNKDGHNERYANVHSSISVSHVYTLDDNRFSIVIAASVLSLSPSADDTAPITRTLNWTGTTLLSIGERRVVFSSDDLASKHTIELEVTATRLK